MSITCDTISVQFWDPGSPGPLSVPGRNGTRVTRQVYFWWRVTWGSDQPTGWIVQRIHASTVVTSASAAPTQPDYWEAWRIDSQVDIRPHTDDYWTIEGLNAGTQGHWQKTGTVYYARTLPACMTQNSLAVAGPLWASLSISEADRRALGRPILQRQASGRWGHSRGGRVVHEGPRPTIRRGS